MKPSPRRRDSESFAYKELTTSLRGDDPEQVRPATEGREHLAQSSLGSPTDDASQGPNPLHTLFSGDAMPFWRHFEATRYGNAGNAAEQFNVSSLRRELRQTHAQRQHQQAEMNHRKMAAEFAPRQLNPHTGSE